jgi:hypothetical protein
MAMMGECALFSGEIDEPAAGSAVGARELAGTIDGEVAALLAFEAVAMTAFELALLGAS